MHVAMYYSNKKVRTEKMPVPKIKAGEILMEVKASGICGSDVMEWYRAHKVPLVLGHEVAGTIARIAKGVKKYKAGERIVAAHHVPCMRCHYCKSGHPTVCDTLRSTNFYPGGFSEFVRLPAINVKYGVFRIPKNVSYEEATFAEPVGCVLRGQRLAGTRKRIVFIVGAGVSGMLHLQVARLYKAKCIVVADVVEKKLKIAKRFGADGVINAAKTKDIPGRLKEITGGRLADVVILCASAKPALRAALGSVDRGGTVLIFSAAEKNAVMPLSVNDIFWRTEVRILSSYAAGPREHIRALRLLSEKKINVSGMITHRLPLTKAEKGFKLVAEGKKALKVIIKPNTIGG